MKIRPGSIPAHFYIFLSALALYIFSLQQNFSAAHDSITYLNNIGSGKNLFHPHHLLYNFIAHYWLVFWQTIFPSARDYIVIEILSAIFGSACIAVCYLFLRRRARVPGVYASLAVAVIAFSYGVWSYSSNIEVYAPPLFFSLLVLYQVTSIELNERKVLSAALCTVLAILFHQVHVLLAIVVTVHLFSRFRDRHLFRALSIYILTVTVLVVAIYLFIAFYVEGIPGLNSFISWVTLYAHGHDYWKSPGFSSLALAATGFAHAFFGGHFIFKLPVQHLSDSMLRAHNLADEHFLIRNLSAWQAVVLLLLMLFVLTYMFNMMVRFFRKRSYRNRQFLPILHSLILYSCFFFFWMPENLEFWIFQSLLFWILVFAPGPREATMQRELRLVGVVALAMFVINYAGSMKWLQKAGNDWYYAAVQPIVPVSTSEDLVISKDPWIMDEYVRRFVSSKQIIDSSNLAGEMEGALRLNARVFIIDAQDSNLVKSKDIESVLDRYRDRTNVFADREPRIYLIH